MKGPCCINRAEKHYIRTTYHLSRCQLKSKVELNQYLALLAQQYEKQTSKCNAGSPFLTFLTLYQEHCFFHRVIIGIKKSST